MKDFKEFILEKLGVKGEPNVNFKELQKLSKDKQVNIFIKDSGSMNGLTDWVQEFIDDVKMVVKGKIELFSWTAKNVSPIKNVNELKTSGPGGSCDAVYDFINDNYNVYDPDTQKYLNIIVVDSVDPKVVRNDKENMYTYFYINKTKSGHESVFVLVTDIK